MTASVHNGWRMGIGSIGGKEGTCILFFTRQKMLVSVNQRSEGHDNPDDVHM